MIGSAVDQEAKCMETMKGFTGYFGAMDPREIDAVDPQTGQVHKRIQYNKIK